MSVGGFTSYDIKQDQRFAALLSKIEEGGRNQRIVMGEAARIIKKFSKANFILKGDGKYPPLKEDYADRKERKFGELPILVVTGRLRDSVVTGGENRTHEDSVLEITKDSLILGTKVPYAAPIQEGSKRGLPARKFLFLTDSMVDLIVASAEANLERVLRKA